MPSTSVTPGKATLNGVKTGAPIICLSHLRWNFVFQRPQHLMTRALQSRRVFYWEEPDWIEASDAVGSQPGLRLERHANGITVATPVTMGPYDAAVMSQMQRRLLRDLIATERLQDAIFWYYTPAALSFSEDLIGNRLVVYDAMDELSAFMGADPALPEQERRLLKRADLAFTGGFSLFEAKRHQHDNIHPFPSGVDLEHFLPARTASTEPDDQVDIPHPRLGFYGVIDERLDRRLIAEIAQQRPDWHVVMIGPVVKIDPASLPQGSNIHYLGGKSYDELPRYLAGWDVALLPFARNEATRFISPTKTPEYLAGGKPVVSTPITDVVRQYGHARGVRVAASPEAFISETEAALRLAGRPEDWLPQADELLAACSWEDTWSRMSLLLDQAACRRTRTPAASLQAASA